MEAFVEVLLKRKTTLIDKISLVCSVASVILISVVGICLNKFVFSLFPLVVLLDFFIIYHIVLHKQVEFEYIIIGNEVDIDKIMGKRKRKRLLTIKRDQVVFWGDIGDKDYENHRKRSSKVINASSDKFSRKNKYVVLNDDKRTIVILDDVEDLLKVIKK